MRNSNDARRQLLVAVLAGDVEALRAYKMQMKSQNDHMGVVIDEREVGGPITRVNSDGEMKELSPEEFAALPEYIRNNCVVIIDTTNGNRVPDPDEDYYLI